MEVEEISNKHIGQTKLWNIIYPYDNWFNNDGEDENEKAKLALYKFYNELLNYKPSKEYSNKEHYHFSYIRYLIEIKKAINEELYQRACNELISLMHYEPFFQGRIYYNVLDLLRTELSIGGAENAF